MGQTLTVEQVDFFRDNGYLVLRDVLEPALMAADEGRLVGCGATRVEAR